MSDDFDDEDEAAEDRKVIARAGTFSVQLVPDAKIRNSAPDTAFPAYAKVLRPLLEMATECWVYGMKKSGPAFRAIKDLLEPETRRWRIDVAGEPIRGRELFWNATGGERGSIVILVPERKFEPAKLFRGCAEAFVFGNFRTAHTPAAIRYARERVKKTPVVALCLSATNGMEWIDVHVKPRQALRMFDVVTKVCKQKS